jgi:hypothetical protein
MAVGFTYTSFTNTLAAMLVIDTANDTDWATYLPSIIDQAELRILRELDPMIARKDETLTLGTVLPSSARIGVPTDLVVLRDLGVYTPAGTNADTGGSWNQLLERDPSFIREVYPSRATSGVPQYFARLDDGQLLLAPSADAGYTAHMFMTARPAPLSVTNATTWLASNVPDLLLFAAAVAAGGFLKQYGAIADDPQAPVTWEKRYQTALVSALAEEARRKSVANANNPASTASAGAAS